MTKNKTCEIKTQNIKKRNKKNSISKEVRLTNQQTKNQNARNNSSKPFESVEPVIFNQDQNLSFSDNFEEMRPTDALSDQTQSFVSEEDISHLYQEESITECSNISIEQRFESFTKGNFVDDLEPDDYKQFQNSRPIIGIDIGTENLSVAIYNMDGWRFVGKVHKLLSFVYYSGNSPPVASFEAKSQAEQERVENGIYQIKNLLGRKFNNREVKECLSKLLYEVECDKQTKEPVIYIKTPNTTFGLTPLQVYTTIFSNIRTTYMEKIGSMPQAVITVPASFNFTQRQDTLEAAKRAGFHVLKLLNESTASFLWYRYANYDVPYKPHNYYLIYDLGATLNITILRVSEDFIETVESTRYEFLGGNYFDTLLVTHIQKVYKEMYGVELNSDKKFMVQLQNLCKHVKQQFLDLENQKVELNKISNNLHNITITRNDFLNLITRPVKKSISFVETTLNDHNILKDTIKKVIICGASTKITYVQELLIDYFEENTVHVFHDPEASVAKGAALQASMLFRTKDASRFYSNTFLEVTPLSIGIEAHSNLMYTAIKRNTPIPCKITMPFKTLRNNQQSCTFKIYEGERMDCRDNRELGVLIMDNLAKGPRGERLINLEISIDRTGILQVRAEENNMNNAKILRIEYTRGDRSDAEIQHLVQEAEDNKEKDQNFFRFVIKKEMLIDYCQSFIYHTNEMPIYQNQNTFCVKMDTILKNVDTFDDHMLSKFYKKLRQTCKYIVKKNNFLMPLLDRNAYL